MKNPTKQQIAIFGASVVMRNLNALVQEIEGVRSGVDIECVHRMRVASRRMRSALPLFGPALAAKKHEAWRKQIRGITNALGEARDTDVQIEHLEKFLKPLKQPERGGVQRLLLRMQQKRAKLQKEVVKTLDKFIDSRTIEAIAARTAPLELNSHLLNIQDPGLARLACTSIVEQLQIFLDYDPHVRLDGDTEELHAMRIAAKRLRYSMEFFTSLYENELKPHIKAIRSTQDMLGELHDADVWIAYLPQFMEEERRRTLDYFGYARPFQRLIPGLILYQNHLKETRQKVLESFIKAWNKWKAEGFWEQLRTQLIDTCEQTLLLASPSIEDTEKDSGESPGSEPTEFKSE